MTLPKSARSAINKIYFDQNAFTYEEDAVDFNFQTPEFVSKDILELLADKTDIAIYETGIGTGLLYKTFMKNKSPAQRIQYYGCDLADNMLGLASKVLPQDHLHRVDIDYDTLPMKDSSVDATVSTSVFQFLDNPDFAVGEMARITKPGGYIAIAAVSVCKHESWLSALRHKIGRLFSNEPAYRETLISAEHMQEIFEKHNLHVLKNIIKFSHSHWQAHNYDCYIIGKKPSNT